MPPDVDESVSPDEAFTLLGNDTRVRILQALGRSDDPLSFTELRDRVGIAQGAQFNYHLDKLVGHFVAKTDEGYALRQPGRRIVQAILSGAVTSDPVLERTRIDGWCCPYCGAPTEMTYRQERLERYCTECPGIYGERSPPGDPGRSAEFGTLGSPALPPAGVQGRSPPEVLQAAYTWGYARFLVAANGVCPHCSARVEFAVEVCDHHDTAEQVCSRCGQRQAVGIRYFCTTCTFLIRSVVSMHVAASTELLGFMIDRGIDPLADPWDWGWEYEEEVLATDPFEGRFTFAFDGDTITLAVDDDLSVVDVTRHEGS